MKKIIFGIILGLLAGIIDLVPMILQKITWDANLSALFLWVVSGFLIASSNLNIKGIFKGILISFLVLIPCAFIIGWKEPINLLPITIMTLILGSLLGFFIDKYSK
jgi:hypothetical protein